MLTQKQKACIRLAFSTNEPAEAYLKIYKCKSKAVASACATRLLKTANARAYLTELEQKKDNEAIAGVQERQEILTEIARGNLTDYQEAGADGSWINIGSESPNTRAISEITSRTEYDKDSANSSVITKIKLHSPISAIAELNKMDGAYAPEKHEHTGIPFYTLSLPWRLP